MSVSCLVHINGRHAPISKTDLKEAWSDGVYYFSSISFRKSGNYEISFVADGGSSQVKPLVFSVSVEAKIVKCGLVSAFDTLIANEYVQSTNRAIIARRKELLNFSAYHSSELGFVKAVLLTVYAALPSGSLLLDPPGRSMNGDEFFASIAEPVGWNDIMDQVWRGAVISASTPLSLMECVLLLEYYINKSWLGAPNVRLLNSLPNAHFAIRCCTLSSVSLRIFCLDKCLLYEKVHIPPRERRTQWLPSDGPASRDDEPEEDYEDLGGRRGQRRAAVVATHRLKQQKNGSDNEGNGSDDGDAVTPSGRPARRRKKRAYSSEEEDEGDYNSDEDDNSGSEEFVQPQRQSSRLRGTMTDVEEKFEPVKRVRVEDDEDGDEEAEQSIEIDFDAEIATESAILFAGGGVDRSIDIKIRFYSILRHFKKDSSTSIFWTPVDARVVKGYRL